MNPYYVNSIGTYEKSIANSLTQVILILCNLMGILMSTAEKLIRPKCFNCLYAELFWLNVGIFIVFWYSDDN